MDVAAATVMVTLVATAATGSSYSILWSITRALAPFVVVLGAFAILRRAPRDGAPDTQVVALIVLVAGLTTLTQFPFMAPVYFCYVVPLVLLAAIATLRHFGQAGGLLPAVVLAALVVFGVRQIATQSLLSLGKTYERDPQGAILDERRASIHLLPEFGADYRRVQTLVSRHRTGDSIFAGPDTPEIYFLTESKNLTPSIMDFLDTTGSTRGSRLIELLSSTRPSVIVINHNPDQSPRLESNVVAQIRSMYGHGERVNYFEVRWLDSEPKRPTAG